MDADEQFEVYGRCYICGALVGARPVIKSCMPCWEAHNRKGATGYNAGTPPIPYREWGLGDA